MPGCIHVVFKIAAMPQPGPYQGFGVSHWYTACPQYTDRLQILGTKDAAKSTLSCRIGPIMHQNSYSA
jgi:hypothetical protein